MRTAVPLLVCAVLAGCAGFDGRGLVPGESTAQEVETLMGPSADQRQLSGGESVRYYSRQPYGRMTYAARIGADGKLVSLEQRLTEENLVKLVPGVSRADDVRALFGPPYRTDPFPNLQRDVWTYKMLSGTFYKDLYVQLSSDGIVREVMMLDDPDDIKGMTKD